MGEVAITINGRIYNVACDDGQEQRLMELGDHVGRRVDALAESVGQVGDASLLVMASLLIADELSDLRAEFDALRGDAEAHLADAEEALAERLDALASRLEMVAAGLEAP